MVSPEFTANARRLGIVSAAAAVLLAVAYAVVLALGLASLHSPQQPIGDPFLPLMEILIILTAPAMVAVMVSVHAWASPQTKVFSLAALVFIGLMAALTCAVHFAILSLSRQPVFASQPWAPLFFGWTWPSVVYALDIMAWDVFFALAVLFAAPVFGGSRLALWTRGLLIVSGLLALGGLSGVVTGDMQLRNIGIVGYAVIFPVAVALIGILFKRASPVEA